MESGIIAAVGAACALVFVESLRRLYPSRETWRRLRRARGAEPMRKMRERFEASAARRTPRWLVLVLAVLVVAWIASSSLLDKRWYEVVLDVLPYVIVGIALLRTPPAMGKIGERMKGYEKDHGDEDLFRESDGDIGEIAL